MSPEHQITSMDSRSNAVEQNDFISRVYGWMALGLFVTSFVAYVVVSSEAILYFVFGTPFVFYGLLILELVVVIYLARYVVKMSATQASFVFLLYSALNGLTISVIFLVYEISSIGTVFMVTAGMFAIISFYGFVTKQDLTTVGHISLMALIGIILASVFNLFIQDDRTTLIISYISVVVFVALTAYDTQKIKNLNISNEAGSEMEKKTAIIGALTLYLDFINLFLNLLRIMGRRK